MSETSQTRDPAEIEHEIRRTQEEMSQTVDRIGDQLTPRNLVNALLDQAESNNIDARTLLDGARRNPIALAMIAGGAIWLASDSDAKLPSGIPSFGGDRTGTADGGDQHHRDYIAHMERVDMRDGEDAAAYQRRRDIARANFLMCEKRHDEDDSSFRQRLDSLTEKFREKRQAWTDQGSRSVSSAAQSAGETARSSVAKAQNLFAGSPLIGGLAAAAVGAILGTIIPLTETEEQNLSGIGEKARDLASQQSEKLTEAAREKKDQMVQKVDESLRNSGDQGGLAAASPRQPSQPSDAHDAGAQAR